jgi:hypothetical protein
MLTAIPLAMAVPYTIDITATYSFGAPSGTFNFADAGGPSPETGFAIFLNSGPSTFVGTIGLSSVSGFGPIYSYSHGLTLTPGQSAVFAVNGDSGNVGGFNGPYLGSQNGVEMYLNGSFNGGAPVLLSVFDKDVHSGVFQTNPYGVSLDNYVLQGGDPFGRDNGDVFKVAQANGHFQFSQAGSPVPEPSTYSMLLAGLGVMWFMAHRRKQKNEYPRIA